MLPAFPHLIVRDFGTNAAHFREISIGRSLSVCIGKGHTEIVGYRGLNPLHSVRWFAEIKKTTIWISPDSDAVKFKWSEHNNRGDEQITAPVGLCIIKRLRSSGLRVRTRWSRSRLHCSVNSCP